MDSLWSKYRAEREGIKTFETDKGFICYKITNKECFLVDLYVLPKYRRQKVGSQFVDIVKRLAIDEGCDIMTGGVSVGTNNDTDSLKAQLGYGMKLFMVKDQMIYTYMDL